MKIGFPIRFEILRDGVAIIPSANLFYHVGVSCACTACMKLGMHVIHYSRT